VLPSDLTAIVFSNLLWFLLTLCLGSVLVTRPYRRGVASGSRGAHARSRHDRSLASTGAADDETEPLTFVASPADLNPPYFSADEPATDEDFGSGEPFRVSDYLVLSDYPLTGEELADGDVFADDVVAVYGDPVARDLPDERLAALPPVDWAADTLPPQSASLWPRPLTQQGPADLPPRAALVRARHRRPRPARDKTLAQVAAVAIAVIITGTGIGLGLHMTSGGGHDAAARPGAVAADIFPATAPPVITRPHIATRARAARHHARLASSRFVTLRGHRRAVQAQLAATLNEISFLGHDLSAGGDGRLLPSLNRRVARLRAEIARLDQRLGTASQRKLAERAPARPIRLTSVTKHARATKHAPVGSGHARPSPPVSKAPAGEAVRRAEAVAYAEAQLGKPYEWGGSGPYGFDCSGLVMMAWQAGGVLLAHYTGDQWADTYHISRGQLEPGDLVFSNGFGHVQLYVGHGEVIQAPYTGQVVSYAPLSPAALVDGYASVFPPGQLAPHGRHGRHGRPVGGTRHQRTRGHRRGGQRRWHHSHRGRARKHAHHRRPSRHHRRLRRHRRARGHQRIHRQRHRRHRVHRLRRHGLRRHGLRRHGLRRHGHCLRRHRHVRAHHRPHGHHQPRAHRVCRHHRIPAHHRHHRAGAHHRVRHHRVRHHRVRHHRVRHHRVRHHRVCGHHQPVCGHGRTRPHQRPLPGRRV